MRRARARGRRFVLRWVTLPLVRVSTWTYLAVGALVGFEALEIAFGAFILAPELVPLAVVGLVLQEVLRRSLRRGIRLLRLWRRRRARDGRRG